MLVFFIWALWRIIGVCELHIFWHIHPSLIRLGLLKGIGIVEARELGNLRICSLGIRPSKEIVIFFFVQLYYLVFSCILKRAVLGWAAAFPLPMLSKSLMSLLRWIFDNHLLLKVNHWSSNAFGSILAFLRFWKRCFIMQIWFAWWFFGWLLNLNTWSLHRDFFSLRVWSLQFVLVIMVADIVCPRGSYYLGRLENLVCHFGNQNVVYVECFQSYSLFKPLSLRMLVSDWYQGSIYFFRRLGRIVTLKCQLILADVLPP